jgi:putative ABC transport system ATP-binding protein
MPRKKNNTAIVLELKNVSKTYTLGTQQIHALNSVSLQVKKGDFLSVKGPSGSGKSTFLQVASILAKPSSGKILINGKDTTTLDENERAHLRNREIGFIFQNFNLLAKTSALENVALPLVYSNTHETGVSSVAKKHIEIHDGKIKK